ncbi:MAG TPA: Do family serine endopeptidase [Bacteroidota bacterium]|nr:Do family serine endopeptidase [Bacteroidota bacterium]
MKRSVLTSLVLVTVGIIFGAILVSNFNGSVDLGFARAGGDVKLGGPVPISSQSAGIKAISDNFIAVAKAVTPSVVAITVTTSGKKAEKNMPRDFFHFFGPDFKAPDQQPEQGFGSGVIITPDGYIVTNNHVVDDAEKDGIEVVMHDKIRFKARLVGTDPSTDLAVIKIEAKDLPAAALGNSDNVQVGELALAIGNPLGLTSTVTAGIISAKGRNINIIRDNYNIEDFIQTDAAINPGNSGGALVNMSGEVIGINTAIATTNARYQGYGFAVPVNLLKTVAADLIKEGKVRRGYIGVEIGLVDQTMANALGLNEAKGVLVQKTVSGGAGESAGVKDGDVILSVDGKEVNAPNELQSYIATHHPGDAVTLKIYRDGKTFEKQVTLRAREEDKAVAAATEPQKDDDEEAAPESPKAMKFDNLGMSVRSLTADEKKELEVDKGVMVTDVKPYGEAFNRFVGKNSVIVEADRKTVNSPSDFKKIVDARKPGDSLLLRVRNERGTAFVALQIPK